MVIVEFTIVPIGTGSTSLSCYVADLYKVLEQKTDINFQMNSMSTTIEGPSAKGLDRVSGARVRIPLSPPVRLKAA